MGSHCVGSHWAQVEFVDAPGALGPDVPALHRALWDAVRGTELSLVVVDASDALSHRQVGRFLSRLERELDELDSSIGSSGSGGSSGSSGSGDDGSLRRPQTVLILNKVDRV